MSIVRAAIVFVAFAYVVVALAIIQGMS